MFSRAARASTRFSSNFGRKSTQTVRFISTRAGTQQHRSLYWIGGAILASGFAIANTPKIEASSAPPGIIEVPPVVPPVDFKKVRERIIQIVDDEPSHGPLFVRLAWHASGTFCRTTKSGGSAGGTMRFHPEANEGANAGLHIARDLLEPVKKEFPNVSYGDIWTLASVVAIEEMGGPSIKWRPGRVDKDHEKHCPPGGRLPDADKGQPDLTSQHIREVFYRMGLDDREIVALAGAHSMGRCHPDRSGYDGPWTRAETSFSNEFFRELLENTWTVKKWSGPMQYTDPTNTLMMLPADMIFASDPIFRKYTEMYSKDSDLFFKDFADAFQKLIELGVDFPDHHYTPPKNESLATSSPTTSSSWFSWLPWGKKN